LCTTGSSTDDEELKTVRLGYYTVVITDQSSYLCPQLSSTDEAFIVGLSIVPCFVCGV
jgi:hypothetical protein